MNTLLFITLWIQALYYFITGVWPIVHIRSFMAVTGPKTDLWLVRTVGALIAVGALAMGVAGYQGSISPAVVTLAIGSAAALTLVDVIYVARRVIAPIYLLDAAAEIVLIALWAVGLLIR